MVFTDSPGESIICPYCEQSTLAQQIADGFLDELSMCMKGWLGTAEGEKFALAWKEEVKMLADTIANDYRATYYGGNAGLQYMACRKHESNDRDD